MNIKFLYGSSFSHQLIFRDLDDAVAYARKNDVTTFAVGVKGYILQELLLIAGSMSRVITVQNFNELLGIVEQIQFGIQLLEGECDRSVALYRLVIPY